MHRQSADVENAGPETQDQTTGLENAGLEVWMQGRHYMEYFTVI